MSTYGRRALRRWDYTLGRYVTQDEDPLAFYSGKVRLPDDRPDVAKRLVGIMTAQRRGRQRPDFGRRSGRIDRRNLWRASTGDNRVFTRSGAPSPTRLRLLVLLDMSGSMYGTEASKAAQMGWDLISASVQVPTVTTEVWGHTTQELGAGDELAPGATSVREGGFIKLVELWQPGVTRHQFHANISAHDFGGNEDGFALKVLTDDVSRRLRADERLLVIVISDGVPIYHEQEMVLGHVRGVVNHLRRSGAVVISVSCSESLRKVAQDSMYGYESVIEYTADTNRLTQRIAAVIGKAMN